jgi:hypothetical protein
MGTDPEIANEELEALLAGHGRDKNLDLTRFVDDLSTAFPATAPAAAAHLTAIADQAHLLADKGDPVVRPASNAVAPVPQASRPPKRRRNTMKDKKARILLKVGAPVVAVFAVLGIMGSAGALPRALQHMTSHAAGFVGLNLPTGEDTEGDGTDTTDQGDQNDQGDTTSTDTSDQGDQNDQGTGSSDSSDQGDQNDQGGSTDPSTTDTSDQGDQNDQGTGSSDSSDQGDQNDQGDSTGTSGSGSDQGDQNDQGGSTGSSGGGSSENDQGDGGSSQDNQGDSSGDGGSSSSTSSGDGNSQN